MKVVRLKLISALMLLLLIRAIPSAAQGIPQSTTVSIDKAAVDIDPRLSTPVTLSVRNMPLGKVLDSISRQAGVKISIDERDPASGYPILVQCSGVPVGRIMDSLYGVFSLRHGEWAWTRLGSGKDSSYRLHETPWAKDRTAAYRRLTDGLLRRYLDILRRLAAMTPEERKRHRTELKRALLTENDDTVDYTLTEPLFWLEAEFFFRALSPDQQDSLLNGNAVSVDLKDLPADVVQLYRERNKNSSSSEASPVGADGSQIVSFTLSSPMGVKSVTPSIWIGSGKISGTYLGTGLLGFSLKEAVRRAWMIAGDSDDDAAGKVIVKDAPETPAIIADRKAAEAQNEGFRRAIANLPKEIADRMTARLNNNLGIPARLEQLSAGGAVPIIAVLAPNSNPRAYSDPTGKPVQSYVDILCGRAGDHMYKWRNGALLLNYPEWFMEPTSPISASTLAALRPDPSGNVTLARWQTFMDTVSDDQSEWFAANYGLGDLKPFRACVLLAFRNPDVVKEAGIELSLETYQILKSLRLIPFNLQRVEGVSRFRIRTKSKEGSHQSFIPEYLEGDIGRWTPSWEVGFPIVKPTAASETK